MLPDESANSELLAPSQAIQESLEASGIHATVSVRPDARIGKEFNRRVVHISIGAKD